MAATRLQLNGEGGRASSGGLLLLAELCFVLAVQCRLGLPTEQSAGARRTARDHGWCGPACVVIALDDQLPPMQSFVRKSSV